MEERTFSWSGAGTKEEPYLIENQNQLDELALSITTSKNYRGQYFRLTADICIQQPEDWYPIGYFNAPFEGSFDGCNHTVSGLILNQMGSDEGFFGILGEDAVVENMKIDGKLETESYNIYLGMIAGTNSGLIRNCEVSNVEIELKVTERVGKNARIGMITGDNQEKGRVEDCVCSGSIILSGSGTGEAADIQFIAGGVAGENGGTISGCSVKLEGDFGVYPHGWFQVGGICALNQKGGKISGSYLEGSLSRPDRIGGLLQINDGTVEGCICAASLMVTASSPDGLVDGLAEEGKGTQQENQFVGTGSVIFSDTPARVMLTRVHAVRAAYNNQTEKEQKRMKKTTDTWVTKNNPLYLGDETAEYGTILFAPGGHIVFDGDAKLTVDCVKRETEQEKAAEQLSGHVESARRIAEGTLPKDADIIIRAANHGPGSAAAGRPGGHGGDGANGGDGGSGGNGKDGESVPNGPVVEIIIRELQCDLTVANVGIAGMDGGSGGSGGDGGNGIDGGIGGRGGDGGNGGNGGDGGDCGDVTVYYVPRSGSRVTAVTCCGRKGYGGSRGEGGAPGRGPETEGGEKLLLKAERDRHGSPGISGNPGNPGGEGTIQIYPYIPEEPTEPQDSKDPEENAEF